MITDKDETRIANAVGNLSEGSDHRSLLSFIDNLFELPVTAALNRNFRQEFGV